MTETARHKLFGYISTNVRSSLHFGTITVRAKTKSILDLAGMLKAPEGKNVRIEDMNPWRRK